MDIESREVHAFRFLRKFTEKKTIIISEYDYNDEVGSDILIKRGLIETLGDGHFTITRKGKKVLFLGGWINYLDHLELNENRVARKEYYDFLFSKYRYKTFWLLFILAVFGGLYSTYDFIERLNTKEDSQQEQTAIGQSESELSKQRILPSIQKNHDSLYDSRTQPDSLSEN